MQAEDSSCPCCKKEYQIDPEIGDFIPHCDCNSKAKHPSDTDGQHEKDSDDSLEELNLEKFNYFLYCGEESSRKGDLEQAVRFFTKALEIDPLSTKAWLQRGLVNLHINSPGCLKMAMENFEKAIELDNENGNLRKELTDRIFSRYGRLNVATLRWIINIDASAARKHQIIKYKLINSVKEQIRNFVINQELGDDEIHDKVSSPGNDYERELKLYTELIEILMSNFPNTVFPSIDLLIRKGRFEKTMSYVMNFALPILTALILLLIFAFLEKYG